MARLLKQSEAKKLGLPGRTSLEPVSERLSFKVWAGAVEPHPRGRQFSIHTEARVGDQLVWEEVSTNLNEPGLDCFDPCFHEGQVHEFRP